MEQHIEVRMTPSRLGAAVIAGLLLFVAGLAWSHALPRAPIVPAPRAYAPIHGEAPADDAPAAPEELPDAGTDGC